MDFSFVKLYITLRLAADVTDPLILFRLRGALHQALRMLVHCDCARCADCPRAQTCPCFHTFGQTLSSDPEAIKKYQKPPLPFIFLIPKLESRLKQGMNCEIGLILIGTAVNYCSLYLAAIRLMLSSDFACCELKAEVVKVECAGYDGMRVAIKEHGIGAAPEDMVLLSWEGLVKTRSLSLSKLPLKIVTPLRLMQHGSPLRNVSASDFLRVLLRRVSSLAYYYGGIELDVDFKWLASRSCDIRWSDSILRWEEWSRSLCGIVGGAALTGDLAEFHQFLLLGEYVHLGKGASDGLGQFRLSG